MDDDDYVGDDGAVVLLDTGENGGGFYLSKQEKRRTKLCWYIPYLPSVSLPFPLKPFTRIHVTENKRDIKNGNGIGE